MSRLQKWGITFAIIVVSLLLLGNSLVVTNARGQFQVRQAAITGDMSVRLDPGMYGRWFADIDTWRKATTFFFTADKDTEEDTERDMSIEVRFNDGSLARISGTARITMPASESQILDLIVDKGFRSYADVEQKMILPTIRNSLRSTANLMTARQSYSEQRLDYINWARDQIQNGLYSTEEITRKVLDVVSGEQVTRTFKIIKRTATGEPEYQFNALAGTGIIISNFEIKQFVYATKVQAQIAAQQEALMAVETARARAKEAEQKALTVEAEGKAAVMAVRYEKEQTKIAAVVDAEKELAVARLATLAAAETKKKEILLGQGESERRRLVLQADGALAQKLATFEKIQGQWANAYATRLVPQLIMGGSGGVSGTDRATVDFSQAMQLLVAKQLGLDLTVPKGTSSTTP